MSRLQSSRQNARRLKAPVQVMCSVVQLTLQFVFTPDVIVGCYTAKFCDVQIAATLVKHSHLRESVIEASTVKKRKP
jgi:hypothetical protein